MRRVLISGMIGNGLEWYDYALYGHMAVVLGTLFFPPGDPFVQLLATFAVFAVGFFARPFGGMLFGWIGDRYGRRMSLAISIVLMAGCTGAIGLMPTYAQVGILAPVMLVVIRVVQGLSLGGEFSGSIIYMVEHAPADRRGIAGSAAMFSLVLGFVTGALVSTLFSGFMPQETFMDWGWRVPFLIGIVIGGVGFYIRSACDESPVYEAAREANALSRTPLREALMRHPKAMLQAVGIYFLVTMPFYLVSVYFIAVSKQAGFSMTQALSINLGVMVLMGMAVPISGMLSDVKGRKPVLRVIALVFLAVALPLFFLLNQANPILFILGQALFALLVGFMLGPVPAVLVELFPTRVRYSGMALSYNIAAALFGGTAPMVSLWLTELTGTSYSIAGYVMLAALAALVAVKTMPERFRDPI